MTVAVCLRCAAIKHGAWTLCTRCGFLPEEGEDLAKSVMLTDHCFDRAALDGFAEQIESGQGVSFDPEAVKSLAEQIARNPDLVKGPRGCRVAAWTIVALMVVLLILAVTRSLWVKPLARWFSPR
jgi:hypothetical protein